MSSSTALSYLFNLYLVGDHPLTSIFHLSLTTPNFKLFQSLINRRIDNACCCFSGKEKKKLEILLSLSDMIDLKSISKNSLIKLVIIIGYSNFFFRYLLVAFEKEKKFWNFITTEKRMIDWKVWNKISLIQLLIVIPELFLRYFTT